jgi:phosphate transport system substrate-binding protein
LHCQQKTKTAMKKKVLFLAILVVVLAAAIVRHHAQKAVKQESSTAWQDDLKGEISLSGAFALYPLAIQWAEEFKKLHPGVRIDICAGGAGKGITDALTHMVDLGMVSRELNPAEREKGAVTFAVAKDAVVPTVNSKNPVIETLRRQGAKREDFVNIWVTGQAKRWGDITGNGETAPVKVYTRSDACGAAETWAAYLGTHQEGLNGTAVYGDPGVAFSIQHDVQGIGMNNIGYVFDGEGKPNPGIEVLPIDINENGKIDPDEDFYRDKESLIRAIADGRYPTPPARYLYLVSDGTPRNKAVRAFLHYIITQGQQENEAQGYIAIGKADVRKGLAQLKTK